jgi:hypothetical protein
VTPVKRLYSPFKLPNNLKILEEKASKNNLMRLYSKNLLRYFGNFPCLIYDTNKNIAVGEEIDMCGKETIYLDVTTDLRVSIFTGEIEHVEEQVIKDEVVINSTPEEAIVLLFDTSQSMIVDYDENLVRIDAAKEFFYAFSDRVMAYKFPLVIALINFNHEIMLKCQFTEVFRSFKNHIEKLEPEGYTRLYDSLIEGTNQLIKLGQTYPNVIKRIICFSDGEDSCSKKKEYEAAQYLRDNHIIVDSVNVGCECEELKAMSFLTGGYSYFLANTKEGMKLFESETFLRAKIR